MSEALTIGVDPFVAYVDVTNDVDVILRPTQRRVIISDPADAHNIYLPPVLSAVGKFLTVYLASNTDDKVVSLVVSSEDSDNDSYIYCPTPSKTLAFYTALDYVVLYCDGKHWIEVGGYRVGPA